MQTEAEAFLQRIRAFPDEDTPRLIFADWLDEFGDPRGQFIRVQLALAQMNEELLGYENPGFARAEREATRAALMVQERELLELHREDWTAPFRGLATGLEFRRGFVEEVRVPARSFLRHVHELFAAGPIRHLHLLDVGASLPVALQCPYLNRLNAFTVYAQHAGEALARAVSRAVNLSELRSLFLGRNRLEDAAAEHLANSPVLFKLEELDLSENEVGETGARAIAASSNWPALSRLELRNNRLGPAGAEALAGSERLASLSHLGLSGNELGSSRIHSVARMCDLLRVPILDLSMNSLDEQALMAILNKVPPQAESPSIRLRELDLSHNELGDHGARVIAACPALEGLRVLRLIGCGIGDDGARAIAESSHLNRLTTLDLGNNPVNDPGFRGFLDTPQMRSLRRLAVPQIGVSIRMRRALEMRYLRGPG